MPLFSKLKWKGKKKETNQQGSRVEGKQPTETEGPSLVQNEDRQQDEGENRTVDAIWEGALAVLRLAKESTDAVPIAKGAIGGLVWILEACQQFKDNRKDWADLADEIATVSFEIINRCGPDPSADLKKDMGCLERILQNIQNEIKLMKKQPWRQEGAFVKKNHEAIIGLREKFKTAISHFGLYSFIAMRQQLDSLVPYTQGTDNAIASAHSRNLLGPSEPAISMATIVPPSPDIFYGREDVVNTMVDMIRSKADTERAARLAIIGPGGIEKTSIAVAVLNHPSLKSPSLFDNRRYFVSCEALTTGTHLMLTILFSLGCSKPKGDPLTQLINTLRLIAKPSIIVLDNFETCWHTENRADIRMVLQQLADVANLTILIMMRGNERPDGIKWDRLESIKVLELEAARAAFLDIATDVEPDDQLDSLLRAIDCVPLAVTLLARVAQSTSESASSLLRIWQQEKTALLNSNTLDKQDNLDVSIKLSLNCKPMKDNPYAIRLLSILALLPDGARRSYISRLTTEPALVDPALRTLKQVALVYEDGAERVRILAPIREFLDADVKPDDEDTMQVYNFFVELACEGNCEPGDELYLRVQQELGAESANVSWILEKALNSWETEALEEAVLGFSRYLYWNRPDPDLLLKFILRNKTNSEWRSMAQCQQSLGNILHMQGSNGEAEELFREARSEFQAIGDRLGAAQCLKSLGDILRMQGSYGEAEKLLREAQSEFQAIGDRLGAAQCLRSLGNILQMQDSYGEAEKLLGDTQSEFQAIGDRLGAAQCLQLLGNILQMQGGYEEAEKLLREAQSEFQAIC